MPVVMGLTIRGDVGVPQQYVDYMCVTRNGRLFCVAPTQWDNVVAHTGNFSIKAQRSGCKGLLIPPVRRAMQLFLEDQHSACKSKNILKVVLSSDLKTDSYVMVPDIANGRTYEFRRD
jgi:hypothetical protein